MASSLPDIPGSVARIVRFARTGYYADAASLINQLLQLIQPRLTSGRVPPELLRKISYSLETMMLMQQQQDWVGLADVLEYELAGLLEKAGAAGPPPDAGPDEPRIRPPDHSPGGGTDG